MATGQSLLDLMELVNRELQLQSGEADVSRGLTALNAAQDYFESVVAQYPDVKGGSTGDVTASANTETTAFPTGFLRIDGAVGIESSLPKWPVVPIYTTGGHSWSQWWPYNILSTTSTGRPRAYWTNGTNIYWSPVPSASYTIRIYGFKAASAITAAGTFAYDDIVMLPLASFAARLFKTGLDDPGGDLMAIAKETFQPVVETLAGFQREMGRAFNYSTPHDT